jgi:glycosyltransferase involved in cell wall biosynthesis
VKAIVLLSDAYGGRGGIALYNRYFLRALCEYEKTEEVLALPRSITYGLEQIPSKLVYRTESAGGKLRYLLQCLRLMAPGKRADLIICGHLHLLPFAWLISWRHRCPVLQLTFGIEAWTPTVHRLVNRLCRRLKAVVSIRKLTASRFKAWAGLENAHFYYLPNCIDEAQFAPAAKRQDLVARFGLEGKQVVMTTGRMDSIDFERRKGFDEVIEALPELRRRIPEIAYLIVGDGDDRPRLEQKVKELGVADIVRFSGYVPDSDKADYYRLAHVFAMPGSNPLFDRYPFRFVFLEALACGVPVVGCQLEDPAERDDLDAQQLIIQVNPNDNADIIGGILYALAHPLTPGNSAIRQYCYAAFRDRLHHYLREIVGDLAHDKPASRCEA